MNKKTRIDELAEEDICELIEYWNVKAHDSHHELNHSDGKGFMNRLLGDEEMMSDILQSTINLSAVEE